MLIEIKCRFTGAVLYSGEHANIKEAVEAAVRAGALLYHASLAHARLDYASLAHARLDHASLAHASLAHAWLDYASLVGASLAHAWLDGASLVGASLDGIKGNICNSHELLAQVALRFDESLKPVAAMIAGRMVGCWQEYTDAIRQVFGESVMRRLWQA